MVVNKYAKYKQPAPATEQEQEPAPQNKYRKYLQPVPTPTPAAPAAPSLRSETDAIIEEAAANIPGGFAAFDAKPADPKRMAAMGYVQDPLAKSGYAKPRAPEAPIVDSGNTTNAFTDVVRGLEAPIAGLTGGGLEGWAKTTSQDPVRGASEAVDFISPVDDLGRAYQGVKQAGAGLIEGDMAKAAEGAQQASIQGSYAAMQMLPGSMTLKGVTGRAAPTTMAGAERAAVQASRAPQVVKPQAKPEPVLTPPSEAPKPFSAPPEPIGRGVVRRNLDRIIGGGVGATLGGTGDAMAAPGDGDSGGLPGGAATGAAIGIFGPRALAAAGSRGFRAAARAAQSPASRAGFDERVAARAVRKSLVSGGINTEQDALNAARAKFGDKPASVADLTQEGVGMSAGLSRLPGATGDAARARGEDLLQNRAGRLERDIGGATGASPATIAGDVDRMVALAREQAKPAYDALKQKYPAGSVKSDRLSKIEGIGSHIKAVDEYRAATKANEGRDLSDFEYWDLVKRDIDAKEQQLINSGATLDDIRVRKLEGARAALVVELDDLMKGYAAARELGGEAPKMNAAFKQGQGLLGGRYTAEDVSRVAESVTGQPLTALQAGVIRSMVGKTEGAGGAVASLTSAGARRKLERVFGKGPADEMQARFAADAAIVQNASRMNPNVGSVTSQAIQGGGEGIMPMAADLFRAARNPVETALAAMSKSGSYTKAQRDLMGQMLLDGVTPENVARIFAGKKPKGGTTPPAGPTTGLGGPAASARPMPGQTSSASPTVTGALVGGGLGYVASDGDPVATLAGATGLGAASGLAAKAMKGGKPKAASGKPAFDQRFMKEAQRLVSYNGGVDKALKAQQYVIDQLKNSKAVNAQDRLNRAVSIQNAIRRMAEKSNRELDEIAASAPRSGPPGVKPPGGKGVSNMVAGGALGGVAGGLGSVADAQEAEGTNEFLAPLAQERERIKKLEAELNIIENGTVEEKQAYLAETRGLKVSADGTPDGKLGPDTRAAIAKARTDLEAAINAGRDREKTIAGKSEKRRAEIEMKGAFDRTKPDGTIELARELGPWVGIGAGVLAGALMRKGAVKKTAAESAAKAASLNRLVSDATPTTSDIMTGRKAMGKRTTNLNEFFYQGGAGKAENLKQRLGMEPKKGVPFMTDDNGDWMARPNAKEAFDLFKPGTKHFKMMDIAVIGASMAESEFAGNLAKGFHEEAKQAQAAVDKAQEEGNASNLEIAMARLESAKNAEAAAIAFQRFGQVAALARTAGAFKMPYEYTRPNVKKAQADQALILDAIRRSANIP